MPIFVLPVAILGLVVCSAVKALKAIDAKYEAEQQNSLFTPALTTNEEVTDIIAEPYSTDYPPLQNNDTEDPSLYAKSCEYPVQNSHSEAGVSTQHTGYSNL